MPLPAVSFGRSSQQDRCLQCFAGLQTELWACAMAPGVGAPRLRSGPGAGHAACPQGRDLQSFKLWPFQAAANAAAPADAQCVRLTECQCDSDSASLTVSLSEPALTPLGEQYIQVAA